MAKQSTSRSAAGAADGDQGMPVRLLDVPAYREAHENLHRLMAQRNALDSQINEAMLQAQERRRQGSDASASIEALIGGESPGQVAASRRVAPDSEVIDLREQATLLDEAIRVQRSRTDNLAGEASRVVVQRIRPIYVALLQELAEKAVALAELSDIERDIRDILSAGEVHFAGWMPAKKANASLLDGTNWVVRFLHTAAKEYGLAIPAVATDQDATREERMARAPELAPVEQLRRSAVGDPESRRRRLQQLEARFAVRAASPVAKQ